MDKPGRSFSKPLREVAGKILQRAFVRQGFASAELVTRWEEIVGAEIAAHSEPIKIHWQRPDRTELANGGQGPGTLVLRVAGPAAIEVQHLAAIICERVNRFAGWRAVDRVTLRQAPLRRGAPKTLRGGDPIAVARVRADLPEIADDRLRDALARLGAAVKRA